MSLNTFDEARAAGLTSLQLICEKCRRSSSISMDVLERKTKHRSLDEAAGAFRCKLCGSTPDKVLFCSPSKKLHYFNYVVAVWDDQRLDIDHVEAASMSLEDIRPAFRLVAKRFPQRWVTLEGRDGLIGASDRFEVLDEVDL